jgi:hypothetical protein
MMPPELRALMERYNALDDLRVRTAVELILNEMAQVRAQIDAFIAAARVS